LPPLLHHFKALTIARGATWKTDSSLFIKQARGTAAEVSRIYFSVSSSVLGLIGIPAHWLNSPKKEIAGSKIGNFWE
jgi:hypothetical protein